MQTGNGKNPQGKVNDLFSFVDLPFGSHDIEATVRDLRTCKDSTGLTYEFKVAGVVRTRLRVGFV